MGLPRWVGRAIGLDVHREFCEVAICEDGVVRSAGRVPATPEGIRTLAESLLPSDRVALEVTGSCWEVARILEPHVNRVVVVSVRMTPGSRARGRRPTSSTLARWRACCGRVSLRRCGCPMSAAGSCAGGWRAASSWSARARGRRTRSTRCCSAGCRASRRALTCSASRAASGWPAWSCRWRSASPSTPAMRHIEFLDAEIAAVEKLIAQQALSWPEIRRLMTVPGREPDLRRVVHRRGR